MATLDPPLATSARGAEAPGEVGRIGLGDGRPASGAIHGLRRQALNFGQLLGSHVGVALAGLVALPVLARNLGATGYGQFSLFMTGLGALSNLDLARPILVRELARRGDADGGGSVGPKGGLPGAVSEEARILAVTSAVALALLALAVGPLLFDGLTVVALAAAVLCAGASSAGYAQLSAEGRVGLAGAIRNACWAAALVGTALGSLVTPTPHAYVWAFLAANAAILLLYQRATSSRPRDLFVRPSFGALRARGSQAFDVAAFAGASAVVASSDKVLLASTADADELGHYAAQYDLATKINIVSTTLASVLLPAFSRIHREAGPLTAATRFVRVASWIALAYFLALTLVIAFQSEIARLVLGEALAGGGEHRVYVLMLVGVFLHLFGFLLTSYQRACGDFRSQRIAYISSAALMLLVGAVTIPKYGALGAVLTYLSGRTAELTLIAIEVRRLPRTALPRWRLVALGLMATTLATAAIASFVAGGRP